jgi:ketosteroid isomerase-like protein
MQSKIERLIRQLLAKSNEGKVKWERTVDTGEFQAAFPGYSVRVHSRPSQYSDALDYFLELRDDEGELMEVISDSDLSAEMRNATPNAYAIMKDLFEVARRTAMGVESALDTILSELEDENTPF